MSSRGDNAFTTRIDETAMVGGATVAVRTYDAAGDQACTAVE